MFPIFYQRVPYLWETDTEPSTPLLLFRQVGHCRQFPTQCDQSYPPASHLTPSPSSRISAVILVCFWSHHLASTSLFAFASANVTDKVSLTLFLGGHAKSYAYPPDFQTSSIQQLRLTPTLITYDHASGDASIIVAVVRG